MTDGYQPQLNPASGVATDFGGAPGDWGAGITQGLESAGNSMDQAIHAIKDKQRDQDATQAAVQFATDSTNLDNAAVALRQQAPAGGDGHYQNVNQVVDNTAASSIANIKDRKLREQFQARYADLKQQIGTREYGWQAGQFVHKIGTDWQTATNIYTAHAAATGDYGVVLNAIPAIETSGHALAVNGDLQEQLIKEAKDNLAKGYAGSAARLSPYDLVGNPATGQKGRLDDPEFTKLFANPDIIDSYRRQAEAQIDHNNAIARSNDAQQKAATLAKWNLFKTDLTTGGHVGTPDEFKSHVADLKAAGLPDQAIEAESMEDVSNINLQMQNMPPPAWHQKIADLEQKVNDPKGGATDFDRMHLKHLIAAAGPAIDKFNADPHAWFNQTPNPPPKIDWSSGDPAALAQQGQQMVTWAHTSAPSVGIVNPASIMLGKDDQNTFREGLKGGDAPQVEALQRLQMAFGPTEAANVAEYLMPGDKNLKFLAALNPRGMALYKEGVNSMNDKLVHLGEEGNTPQAIADRGAIKDAVTYWNEAIPGELQGAFMQVLPKIAAGVAHENGNRNPTGDELKTVLANSVQRLAGLKGDAAHGYTGGIRMVNGHSVWIPQDMGQTDFLQRIARANPDDWVKAGGGAPYYSGPNGKPTPLSPVQMGQLSSGYHLVTTGPGNGIYALADKNGARLKTQHGRDWTINIRNLR